MNGFSTFFFFFDDRLFQCLNWLVKPRRLEFHELPVSPGGVWSKLSLASFFSGLISAELLYEKKKIGGVSLSKIIQLFRPDSFVKLIITCTANLYVGERNPVPFHQKKDKN